MLATMLMLPPTSLVDPTPVFSVMSPEPDSISTPPPCVSGKSIDYRSTKISIEVLKQVFDDWGTTYFECDCAALRAM